MSITAAIQTLGQQGRGALNAGKERQQIALKNEQFSALGEAASRVALSLFSAPCY